MSVTRRFSVLAGVAALAAALVVTGPGSAGATPSPGTAAVQLAAQRAHAKRAADVASRLGDRAAGSYLDRSGHPVVNVLDTDAAARARAAGVTPHLVRHSTAALARVRRTLDALPAVPDSSWGIDPVRDQVAVTVSAATPPAAAARLRAAVAQAGDLATIETVRGTMTTDVLDGGPITAGGLTCSAGFGVLDGRGYWSYLTAGHCTRNYPYWNGIGPTVDSRFPGTDFGLIENDSGDHRSQVNLYPGTQAITRVGSPYVGEPVCKSGFKTHLTCGTVNGVGYTVTITGAGPVNDLILTDTYSAHGDSGGPLFDGATGLGMLSTGNEQAGRYFFQPLLPAMQAYAAQLPPNP